MTWWHREPLRRYYQTARPSVVGNNGHVGNKAKGSQVYRLAASLNKECQTPTARFLTFEAAAAQRRWLVSERTKAGRRAAICQTDSTSVDVNTDVAFSPCMSCKSGPLGYQSDTFLTNYDNIHTIPKFFRFSQIIEAQGWQGAHLSFLEVTCKNVANCLLTKMTKILPQKMLAWRFDPRTFIKGRNDECW